MSGAKDETIIESGAFAALRELLSRRIAILDGAMATMIQAHRLEEGDFRGAAFRDHGHALKGCNDLLVLTRPEVIREIHLAYLRAGADIIETDTFNANRVSLADYALEGEVEAINTAAVARAREAIELYRRELGAAGGGRTWFVGGSIGPTNKTASLSPDVNNPAYRAVTFDDLADVYYEQVDALLAAGVDILIPETTFDTLNLKACLYAIGRCFEVRRTRVPVLGSVTITDKSGRTLSGQTLEAFVASVGHAGLFATGINCALGADDMRPYVRKLAEVAPGFTACWPNAGLPNAMGEYDDTPEHMAGILREFAEAGWLNIAGGCCGTAPGHIARIAETLRGVKPRGLGAAGERPVFAGLEAFEVGPDTNFVMIGERTNVTGSRQFKRLILDGKFDEAVAVARAQVQGGANVIDVNMDEGLLNAPEAMTRFLNLLAAEPDVARVPVMVDSSDFRVIEAGLKCLQGRGIANSISLKEGEEKFLAQARVVRALGAAVVVMAFDEQGQATAIDHKVAICRRAYQLLTREAGFTARDIIFDVNILTVGTGMEEHNRYAINFIDAVRRIKVELPGVLTSGGVSNISFSFRGNDHVREAIHAAFLYHAIAAGLDMGIVNAGQLAVYENIAPALRDLVEDVLFDRRADATERLIAYGEANKGGPKSAGDALAWRSLPLKDRIVQALLQGDASFVTADMAEALRVYPEPLAVIEGPLMEGMNIIGDLFGEGKMFLPQVVKSARVMKKAVAELEPYMAGRSAGQAQGTIVMATVKGDVHDIGKNIVNVVLACNHFRIVDLGVMVPAEKILEAARLEKADIIGLSGLITPSLHEMEDVAREMARQQFDLPLLIGGATTSAMHTAVKIAPHYGREVVHVKDASKAVDVVQRLIAAEPRAALGAHNRAEQEKLRRLHASKERARKLIPLDEARRRRVLAPWEPESGVCPVCGDGHAPVVGHPHGMTPPHPEFTGVRGLRDIPLGEIARYIDWTPFFHVWEISGTYPALVEGPGANPRVQELFRDAQKMLEGIAGARSLKCHGRYGFVPAAADGDDIVVYADEGRTRERVRLPMLRQQEKRGATGEDGPDGPCFCLADFVQPGAGGRPDFLGVFAVTAGHGVNEEAARYERDHDTYRAIMVKALADRLAEAATEWLHEKMRRAWGIGRHEHLTIPELIKERYQGIRPAPGYPACPDHELKRPLFEILDADAAGITLTSGLAMDPAASVCGFVFAHPKARYFSLGAINRDQVADYAARWGATTAEIERRLAPNLAY